MKLDLLWTDQCFLVIVLISGVLMVNGLRKEPIRQAYRRIFSRPLAMSSALLLGFFLVIAVLDSIHFSTNNQSLPQSLLDHVLAPLGDVYEKTYSAPLALHSFSAETFVQEGQAVQRYPRLTYPPHSLQTGAERTQFLVTVIIHSFGVALMGTLASVMLVFLCRWGKRRKQDSFWTPASISAYATLFIGIFMCTLGYWISRELHLLGTGKIGQDVFYYTVKSIRTGLIIGTLTTLFMMPLALLFGIAAGYFGGVVDDVIQYLYTTLSSIPGVLLISASVLSMQTYIANHPAQFATLAEVADARLLSLCFILGITSWTSLCRLLRAETLKLREINYIAAAKVLGTRSWGIMTKHLLPNVMHIVIITLVLDFSFLVLAEAVLSYVGVGVSPLTMSWGNMINAARLELARDPIVWWPMFAAFIFMFILVLAGNLLADAVRDAFDPRQAN